MAKKISANEQVVEEVVMRIGSLKLNRDQAYRIIMAAGHDVAVRRMREAGRKVWSRGDYNAAARFTTRLFVQFGLAPAEALA